MTELSSRRRFIPGDTIVVVKRSHAWYWLPHPYRHISGGWACHWLRLFVLLGRRQAERRPSPADWEPPPFPWAT